MIFGLDFLAGAKYRKLARSMRPPGWALGVFAETFGDALPVCEDAAKDGCPLIRVQLVWKDDHVFGSKELQRAVTLAQRFEGLAAKHPKTKFELSPFCEHNLKNPDGALAKVKAVAPLCEIVNTPWKGGLSKQFKNEVHSTHKPIGGRFNYSFDGENCVDSDVMKKREQFGAAEVFFLWHVRFNLKWSMKDKTPRPQRKALPSKDLIQSVIWLHNFKGQTSVPKKWLVKSHAEKHGAADTKGDKLLIISPVKAKAIELVAGGKVLGVLPFFGTFEGGGFRYYAQKFGYQYAHAALELTGSPIVEIRAGGKAFGRCNPGFRDPTFR